MLLDVVSPQNALLTDRIAPQWRGPLLRLSLVWAALLALFAGDWARMAMLWWDSSTYNHILVVPFILLWLVLQRAGELAKLNPQAWWPGLVLMAGALLVWLLGDISGLATASQLGAVGMVQSAVLTFLGPRVAWALLFPLAYSLFLVPIGDELVPALQMITAEITIAFTHASGIPAMIEGVFIDTPAGLFEVAEACSGVKFLVAMVALGTLVAHVCYRSWWRRAGFMALAVILPIIANGIRAWGTIYIAQSQGISFAAGFDHIFYGWIFFALVMALLLAIGWKFFDRSMDDPIVDGRSIAQMSVFARLDRWNAPGGQAVAAVIALAVMTIVWSEQSHEVEAEMPSNIALPEVAGWERVPTSPPYPWEPRMNGADRILVGSYRNARGQTVDVVYGLYAAQSEGREAGAFGEGALPPESEWRWLGASEGSDGAGAETLQALGMHRRVAETRFRSGEWTGASKLHLKLRTMRDRLSLTARPTATLIVSAEDGSGQDGSEAIADFRRSVGHLGEWMDRAGGGD